MHFKIFVIMCLFNFKSATCYDAEMLIGKENLEYDYKLTFKHYNERFVRQIISGTVTPSSTVTTCICVPPGSCSTPSTTDGSGQIDIRIVTNPNNTTQPPSVCNYGLVRCCQSGAYKCGIRYPPPPNSNANGAGQAAFGAYPWQAAILTIGEVYLGSGALINENHILTAAHKVNNVPIASIKIRLGEWDASVTTEPIPAQDFQIIRSFVHPDFNPNNLFSDVAILRLSSSVNLGSTPTISTICFGTTSFVGQRCYVAGWGKNDFNGAYQAIQKEVDVPVISADACQTSLRNTRLGQTFVLNSTSFICAGGENGKDACTGDGGSPLVCLASGSWYVAGLVAWGIGCAAGGVPGVYVNVATYVPWIQTTLITP